MKARILSAVLAILMILAVCPVISLSAATTDVDIWDGTVAGTNKTLKQMQEECHAAGGPKATGYAATVISKANVTADLDTAASHNGGAAWYIKTAEGLALLSALANGYVTFSEWTDAGTTYAAEAAKQVVRLVKNVDLNNLPWIPVGAYTGAEAAKFIFSGEGNYVRNMNITETADLALSYRCFGLFGIFATKQTVAQVVNLAVIDATIDITLNQPAANANSIFVGGIVGFVVQGNNSTTGEDKLYFNNNIVDANITLTTNGSAAKLQVSGLGEARYQAAVGGMVGYAQGIENFEISNFLVNGRLEIKKTNATDTAVAAGGVFAATNTAPTTTKTNNGLLNMGVVGATMPNGTVPYYGMVNCRGSVACTVWGIGQGFAQTIGSNAVAYGPTADKIWATNNPLSSEKGWIQTSGAGHFPLPGQFTANYATIEASLYDALFQNMGASVRTKEGDPGLRFSVELSEALLAQGVEEYGMLIVPTALIPSTGLVLQDGKAADPVLKVVVPAEGVFDNTAAAGVVHTDKWVFGTTSKQMNVALIGIPDNKVDTDFSARAYVKLNDGSYVYGDIIERNLVDVVETIMTSGSAADQAAVYNAYKDIAENFGEKFNAYQQPQA